MFSKLLPIFIISLLFLSVPILSLGEFYDDWMTDDLLFENAEQEISLKSFELFWSVNTYTPFGYQGKKLPTKGSIVTVNADLKIFGEDPKNLKYSWFLDDIFQESKSGYAQDTFKFGIRRSNGASHIVLLKIFDEERSFVIEKSITIPVSKPEIVICRKDNNPINPYYSASAKEFSVISDQESSFLAFPYFFNVTNLEDLEFSWTFANETTKESSFTANVFGLKIINKKAKGSLEENLKITVMNKSQIEQRAQRTVILNIY